MEISSGSDSDDCQLYTKAAENVEKKQQKFQVEKEELKKLIHLVSDQELENILKNENSLDELIDSCGDGRPIAKSISSSDDSDDYIPLSELRRSLRSKRKINKVEDSHKTTSKTKKNRQSQRHSRVRRGIVSANSRDMDKINDYSSNVRDLGTIILDDDTGYPTSFEPMDFNSRKKAKLNRDSNMNSEDKFNSTLTIESDEDEIIDDDTDVTIIVEWFNGKQVSPKEFKVRRFQKLETIFDELASLEGIPTSRVVLMRNFNVINPSDTPSSLNLTYYGALTGAVSKHDINYDSCKSGENGRGLVEGEITVKLQLETKQTLQVGIMKHHKMKVLYEKCSEELKLPIEKLKINFDGELVDPSESPSDLDLEGDEVFHVYIKK